MDKKLQELIFAVCDGFPTRDVSVSQVFDQRRFAIMAHYAWKHNLGFHPDMFQEALKATELFKSLPEEDLEKKRINFVFEQTSQSQCFMLHLN